MKHCLSNLRNLKLQAKRPTHNVTHLSILLVGQAQPKPTVSLWTSRSATLLHSQGTMVVSAASKLTHQFLNIRIKRGVTLSRAHDVTQDFSVSGLQSCYQDKMSQLFETPKVKPTAITLDRVRAMPNLSRTKIPDMLILSRTRDDPKLFSGRGRQSLRYQIENFLEESQQRSKKISRAGEIDQSNLGVTARRASTTSEEKIANTCEGGGTQR